LEELKKRFRQALAAGDLQCAQACCDSLGRFAPELAIVHAYRAMLAGRMGQHRQAALAFMRAAALEPSIPDYPVLAARSWLAMPADPQARETLHVLLLADCLNGLAVRLWRHLEADDSAGPLGCVWTDGRSIRGWAWAPERDLAGQPVEIDIAGWQRVAPARPWPEGAVRLGLPGMPVCFRLDLAPFVLPAGAPLAVRLGGRALVPTPPPPDPDDGPTGRFWLQGRTLLGWVWWPRHPDRRMQVTVGFADGTSLSLPAVGRRADLLDWGMGDGCYGVAVDLSPRAGPADQDLALLVDGRPLAGLPRLVLPGTAPGQPDALSRRRQAAAAFLARCFDTPEEMAPALLALAPLAGAPAPDRPGRGVTVIMPVHGGGDVVRRALAALIDSRSANGTPFGILVVDDAGPEADLADDLHRLAAEGAIRLLPLNRNHGFAGAVNLGMAAAGDDDVVLLNSDTLVSGDWLDRLRAAVDADAAIGTATPLTNAGTLCSYPTPGTDAPIPDRGMLAGLDRLCAGANAGQLVDLPTAVGFCTYIRRACLADAGALDAAAFPRGYGEENDFCLRASALGWRHVAVPSVMVGHQGGATFGVDRRRLILRGLGILATRYPRYEALVAAVAAADPLLPARRNLDLARLADRLRGPVVLIQTMHAAGGTERFVQEHGRRLVGQGCFPLLLRPAAEPLAGVRLEPLDAGDPLPNLYFRLPAEMEALRTLLAGLPVDRVEIQHTLNHHPGLAPLLAGLGHPCRVMVHDYALICPRITLIDGSGGHCGQPDLDRCEPCLDRLGSLVPGVTSVRALRERGIALLTGADQVLVPTADAGRRIARYAPAAPVTVVPHPDHPPPDRLSVPAWPAGSRLHIVLPGALNDHKGSKVLLACARDAAARDLPLHFAVVGYTADDVDLLATSRVDITGPYAQEDAVTMISRQRGHFALFLSVWPETWCFALTEAWKAGLFPLGFDIGAVGERISAVGLGETFPVNSSPGQINDYVLDAARRLAGRSVTARPVRRSGAG